jgi:hypothetical protein
MKNSKLVVLSPDNFTINHDTYKSEEDAVAAAKVWQERYKHQGYYSSVKYGRIPYDEILDYCKVVPEREQFSAFNQ